MFDAEFTRCKLTGSMFDGCTYGALKVSGGDWSFVGLPGADLRGSRFSEVRLREADLTGARLQSAELRGCDLSGSWLHSADLTGCDLRGSDLAVFDLNATRFQRAVIDPYQAATVATVFGFDVRPG
ncbi:pentapeptide repeat-containing protein [Actinocorallia populi]